MGLTLDQVVPWGRSGEEYRRMFSLTREDLRGRILGCGDGPAGFNAELAVRGLRMTSVDPLYRFSRGQIAARIAATGKTILAQLAANRDGFVWDWIPSPEALGEVRKDAMGRFLEDFPAGRRQGRYLAGELPALPFRDRVFDLALCSHLLFLYSAQLDLAFHRAAVAELCRVAREVRIFPLLTLAGTPSPHLEPVLADFRAAGGRADTRPVPYEFQRGADRMLVLQAPAR